MVGEIKELVGACIEGLRPVAEVLRDTATHLYGIQVKQVLIMGATQVIFDLMLLAWVIWLYFKTKEVMKAFGWGLPSLPGKSDPKVAEKQAELAPLDSLLSEFGDEHIDSHTGAKLFYGVLLIVLWISTLASLQTAAESLLPTLSYIANPEYKAIEMSKDLVQGLITGGIK